MDRAPSAADRLSGLGAYLRTDFWHPITSGGSYGHTCFVAKEIARVSERFVAFMPRHYDLLDTLGVRQVVLEPVSDREDEHAVVVSMRNCLRQLRAAFRLEKPRFVYERLCIGNFSGAALSLEMGIPYLVEYNGSESSMMRTFSGRPYTYESFYLLAEMAAFRQATAISVISEAVRDDLVRRGVSSAKILVNPNGVDVEVYAPSTAEHREGLRRELGFSPEHRVVCFTGTFGGWHGIDVLAAAIPRVLAAAPDVRFLLIGDGPHRGMIDEVVQRERLESVVRRVGRVPQPQGARLLGAGDIFVAPHAGHMVDSRFFGSPTKVFEYMAMGGGIVASDLEQIGEVLSPAFRARAVPDRADAVTTERSVLCTPGSVDEFVSAVVHLARHPEICAALGRNARRAAEEAYSWERHVERLWRFLVDGSARPA